MPAPSLAKPMRDTSSPNPFMGGYFWPASTCIKVFLPPLMALMKVACLRRIEPSKLWETPLGLLIFNGFRPDAMDMMGAGSYITG
jgi:hypothetical protein